MGKVGRVIAGVALITAGVVIGITGHWSLAFAVASMGVGLLTQPKTPDLAKRQGNILENRVGAQEFLPVVYGQAKIAGVFADIRVDPNSQERKRLLLVPAFCHGSRDGSGINAIDELWFDDRLAIIGSTILSPFNGSVLSAVLTNYFGITSFRFLEYEHHLGSSTQAADTHLTSFFPTEWPTTSQGRGICYSRLELWYDTDIYPGGVPTVQVKVRGNNVYDPRDNTWKYSTNPSLCIRDYLLSTIYGMGIPQANLDEQSFIDMANYCDELVTIPGGLLQKRYELNGWVDTSRTLEENVADLCTSCRGVVVNEGDKWRLIIRRQRSVSGFKINEGNTLEGSWQFILPGNDSAPNVGRASYVDPDKNFIVDSVQWPEPGVANSYLDDDNNFEHRLELDLAYTQNRLMAQQIIMTFVKEGREAIGVICTLRDEAMQCRVGDLVEVSHPTPGWSDKIFDVAALLLSPDATVRAVLIEYEPTVYDLDTQITQPTIPDTNLPDPFSVAAPTNLVLQSSGYELANADGSFTPRIRTSWTKSVDPFIDYYQVQARRAAGDSVERPAPFDSTHFSHSGLSAFTASLVWNDILNDNAWHTDTAVAGSWLQLDCGSGITKEFVECRIYRASLNSNIPVYDIEYSDNGSSWTVASASFAMSALGLNSRKWASVGAHRYWRIKLVNTPGADGWYNELQFLEGAWDDYGRVSGKEEPLFYVYPVTANESWAVRLRAINTLGVTSSWLSGNHIPVVQDPRPQVLSITLTNAHSDIAHIDQHTDVSHGDTGHTDAHTDSAHTDHTDHTDSHSDSHSDSGHGDSHSDFHGDHSDGTHFDVSHSDVAHVDHTDAHGDSHTDGHSDSDHTDVGHTDFHSDHSDAGSHSDIGHYDTAHSDHTDTTISHTDVAHVDNHTDAAHSDSAHSDGHTDQTHSDGQFGIGIAIQADQDSASVKAVARKYKNLLTNGGGEQGTVGSQATGWTDGSLTTGLLVATDFVHEGGRSMKITNSTAADSYHYQNVDVVAGQLYQISGWLKSTALPAADAGWGQLLNVDIISGITSWTIVEKSIINTDPTPSQPDVGIQADGVAHDWTYVYCRFIPLASGTARIYLQLGWSGAQSGTAWFDDIRFELAEPNAVDVRTQPSKDGRNVVIELIDAATGSQIQMNPGDQVRVGALAYSDLGGAGVEGPLALASVGLFNVAPVGTDKWVPS